MLAEDIAKMMAMVPLEETMSKNEGTDRYKVVVVVGQPINIKV